MDCEEDFTRLMDAIEELRKTIRHEGLGSFVSDQAWNVKKAAIELGKKLEVM